MELTAPLDKLKMPHLAAQLESVCEQAVKQELGFQEFLSNALSIEWKGRHLKGVEARLKHARLQLGEGHQPIRL